MPNEYDALFTPPRPRPARPYDDIIERHAARAGIDPNLVRAVIGQESSGNPRARSPKNAQGLMQLIPATAQRFGVTDPYDPEQNIAGGVKYLKWLSDRFGGDLDKVLAGYNAGEGAVEKFGGIPPYRETRNYVPAVKNRYQRLSGTAPQDQPVRRPAPAPNPYDALFSTEQAPPPSTAESSSESPASAPPAPSIVEALQRLTEGVNRDIAKIRRPRQLSYGEMRRTQEYEPPLSLAELKQAEDRAFSEAQRPNRGLIPAGVDPRVLKGEQPVDRVAYMRQSDVQSRLEPRRREVFRDSRPAVSARPRGVLSRAAEVVAPYVPGLTSLDTPGGPKTDVLRGAVTTATLGAVDLRRSVTPEERLLNPQAETEQYVAESIGSTAGALVPFTGAARLVNRIASLQVPTRAAAAARTGLTFGSVEAARQAIQAGKIGEFSPDEILVSAAIGVAMGGIPAARNPTVKSRLVAAILPQALVDYQRGTPLEQAVLNAGLNLGFEAIGLSREVKRREQTDSQSNIETKPETVESGDTAAQRYDHLQFGRVEVAPNQAGASKGRVKVFEIDNPEKTHYVKKSDLQGRGNARMIPVRNTETVNADTTPLKNRPNDASTRDSEFSSGSGEAQAFPDQRLRDLDVPSQRIVLQQVIDALHNPQVRDRVVKFVPVDVVNNLVRAKSASNVLLHDPAVLKNSAIVPPKDSIAVDIHTVDKLATVIAGQRAEGFRSLPNTEQVAVVKSAAFEASDKPATGTHGPSISQPATTSARKSELATDRAELDLPELPAPQRKSWQQSLSEAKPETAQRLADEVLNKPRALNDTETASLVVRAQQVKNEHAAKLSEIASAADDALPRLRSELETIEREFDSLTRAAKSSGTEKGRTLAAQKLTINQDYDLVSLISRAKAAKGRELTPEERSRYESQANRIAELETKLATAQQRLSERQFDREIERVSRQRKRSESKQLLDEEYAQLRTQLTQARVEARNVQASGLAGLDPEGKITPLIARIAKNRIKAGVKSAEALITEVYESVKDYGWSKENVAQVIRSTIRESDDVLSSWDKRRQTQLLKREAEFNRRLATRDFTQSLKREPPIYNRETARLERQVQELKAKYESELHRAQRGPLGTAWDVGVNVANIPKTLKSMGDVSALLRQGGYYSLTHPVISARAAKDMVRSFTEAGFKNVEAEIKSHPDFQLAKRSGVEFTGVDKESIPLSGREEAYLSNFVSKLPIARQSEQTFVGFLDSQRMGVFNRLASELRDRGLTPERHPEEFRAIARLVNIGTGRGSLGRRGNQIAPALNTLMFSPRLLASRVQLLNNMLNPVAIARMPPAARSRMIKDNVKFAGTIATVLGLVAAAGAKVSTDPDDADFLKIRIGNSRYDILTGIQQPLRFMWRMARAVQADITGDETYAGEDKFPLIDRFARSKASPMAGVIWDYFRGEDFKGRKFNLSRAGVDLLVPLYVDDFREALKEDNIGVVEAVRTGNVPALGRAAARTSPSLVGIGASTYRDSPEKSVTQAEKLARKLARPGKDEAREEAQIELDQKRAELRARSRRGEDVTVELDKLNLTRGQRRVILSARGQTRLVEDFKRLSLDEAATVYSVATRGEQQQLRPLLEQKAQNFYELPEAKRDPVKRKLNSLGISLMGIRPSRPSRAARESRR